MYLKERIFLIARHRNKNLLPTEDLLLSWKNARIYKNWYV